MILLDALALACVLLLMMVAGLTVYVHELHHLLACYRTVNRLLNERIEQLKAKDVSDQGQGVIDLLAPIRREERLRKKCYCGLLAIDDGLTCLHCRNLPT